MSKRTRRPRPNRVGTLDEWAREYPEAKVTRHELAVIIRSIVHDPNSPAPEQPKEIEA